MVSSLPSLTQSIQRFGRFQTDAGEDGEVLQRVEAYLGIAQGFDQVQEVFREVRFERHHKLLVVDAERVGCIDLYPRIQQPDADMRSFIRRWRSSAGRRYQGRVFQNG